MSDIIIKEVSGKEMMRDFIHLPDEIHKEHKNWVPPIYMDEWDFFNKDKNPNFKKNETILLLAYRKQKTVGRIMGIIPKVYNAGHNENNARFAYFETFDDQEAADKLIEHVEQWSRKFEADKLIGPLAFSDKDPQGFLIEGYDQPHVLASNCNFPYKNSLLEKMDFKKYKDLFVYKFSLTDELPELYNFLAQRNLRKGYKLLEFDSKIKARKYIKPILRLVNDTFKVIYASTPFSEDEMNDFANKYLAVIHPKLIKIVLNKDDEVIAFIVAMRDVGKGLKKAKGHLFPLGFIPFLYHQRKSKQMNLLLGAISQDYRNIGIDTILAVSLYRSAKELGLETADSHLILEENIMMRREIERVNGKVYKKYRIYYRDINN